MKNIILFISIALFTIIATQAQSEFRKGIKAGVNFADIGGDFTDNSKARKDFHVGGLVEIPLLKRLSFQTELLYSRQGSKNDTRPTDGPLIETKLDYLLLPVMPKFYFTKSFSILAGPQLAYLIMANNETTGSGFAGGNTNTTEMDISDELKSIEVGGTIGVEYRLPLGLFLQARYYFGISNINELDQIETTTLTIDNENYNNVYQISAGFSF